MQPSAPQQGAALSDAIRGRAIALDADWPSLSGDVKASLHVLEKVSDVKVRSIN